MAKKTFSPETLDLMSAGTMIPACILVAWLIYKWLHSNNWVGEGAEIAFIIFGIVTGFYNFFRIINRHRPGKTPSKKPGQTSNGESSSLSPKPGADGQARPEEGRKTGKGSPDDRES